MSYLCGEPSPGDVLLAIRHALAPFPHSARLPSTTLCLSSFGLKASSTTSKVCSPPPSAQVPFVPFPILSCALTLIFSLSHSPLLLFTSSSYGGIRRAPSNRSTHPFKLLIVKIAPTNAPNSSGCPRRLGHGTVFPKASFTATGNPSKSGVSNNPGA